MYLIIVLLCVVLFKYLWDRRRLYALAWRMPGPIGLPLVGSALLFADSTKTIEAVTKLNATYGKLFSFWMGSKLLVYTSDAAHLETILNSPLCVEKGSLYKLFVDMIGNGLIALKDEEWSKRRRLLNPSFHRRVLQNFVPIFNKQVKVLMGNLEKESDAGEEFDICEHMRKLAMDAICETSMNRDMQTQSGGSGSFLWAWDRGLEIVGDRIFKPWLQVGWIYRMTSIILEQQKSCHIIHTAARETIDVASKTFTAEASKPPTSAPAKDDDAEFIRPAEKHIFIDRALKLALEEKVLSLDDVHNEINNILVAGYETTATSSSYCLLLLAMHPHYQQQVYEEIQSLGPNTADGAVTTDDIAALPFTERCVKETLRMFPPVPYLTRTCGGDLQLGEFTVPPGVELALSIRNVHRSAEYYAEPDRFNPDNFLPDAVARRHPYSFVPFSGGTRTCIGSRYAQYVIKIVLVYVVQRFRLSTTLKVDDLRFRMNVGLCLLNKHMVRLERREVMAN